VYSLFSYKHTLFINIIMISVCHLCLNSFKLSKCTLSVGFSSLLLQMQKCLIHMVTLGTVSYMLHVHSWWPLANVYSCHLCWLFVQGDTTAGWIYKRELCEIVTFQFKWNNVYVNWNISINIAVILVLGRACYLTHHSHD
jgi:hypothetical protein